MPISNEIRRLGAKWQTNQGWPKRLDWIEISGIRGWARQRFELKFPIMAVVGENGVGKSTLLQGAASVYAPASKTKFRFASDFFPDTTWEKIEGAVVAASVQMGADKFLTTIRKPTDRWRGNPDRPKRPVNYIDLSRIQPVSARTGFTKLAKPLVKERASTTFEKSKLERLREIMGRPYELARMVLTDAHATREVPVISNSERD